MHFVEDTYLTCRFENVVLMCMRALKMMEGINRNEDDM